MYIYCCYPPMSHGTAYSGLPHASTLVFNILLVFYVNLLKEVSSSLLSYLSTNFCPPLSPCTFYVLCVPSHSLFLVSYTPQVEKGIHVRKATKVCVSNVLSKPERTSWSLTPHLDTVIIEVYSTKGLSLIGNPLRLCRAKHLSLMNWTYGNTWFYID